jgi:hypothetical protein
MPAQLPVNGVARVSVNGQANGVPIVNVFHVKCAATIITQTGINAIATRVATGFTNEMQQLASVAYQAGFTKAVDLSSIDGKEGTAAMSGTGNGDQGKVPNSACCVISWKIARHYRGGHPRTYIGPMAQTGILNPTTLDPTLVANMGTAAQDFLQYINTGVADGNPMVLVAVHRFLNQAQLNPPQVSVITGATVDNRIDTQRRRLGPDR